VLGKHSGRHALKDRVETLGYTLDSGEIDRVFKRFKEVADVKKDMFDEDLEAIIMDEVLRVPESYELLSLGAMSGSKTLPTSAVMLKVNGEQVKGASLGIGPIDATFRAIANLTGTRSKLLYFAVSSITGGTDAQGEVMVRIEDAGKVVLGQGADPDIITAAAKAYLNGLNRLEYLKISRKSEDR
jgi:2-isopropylmalate synthase